MSEDHCWLSLDGSSTRENAAEVATLSPDKQGEPPSMEDWTTWLYCHGNAITCQPHQVLSAVVASMDTCTGLSRSVLLFSKSIKMFFRYFDPEKNFSRLWNWIIFRVTWLMVRLEQKHCFLCCAHTHEYYYLADVSMRSPWTNTFVEYTTERIERINVQMCLDKRDLYNLDLL